MPAPGECEGRAGASAGVARMAAMADAKYSAMNPTAGAVVSTYPKNIVVVPHSDESPIRRSQRAHRCLRGLRMPKDVLVETRQEVDRVKALKTSLENTILSRGRRLYG